jgi:hypothetical protein
MSAKNTEMQQRFALEYASNGGNGTAAAKAAGYSEKSAHELARQLLEKPHVRELVHQELVKLRFHAGAVGLGALTRIAQNEEAPPAARVAAARSLVEYAGLIGANREPGELPDAASGNVTSYEELLERMGQTRRAANG